MARFRVLVPLALAIAMFLSGVALAADGDPDPTFSGDGFALAPVGGGATGFDVAVDSQGRIVAVGRGGLPSGLVVVRYLPDGTLDPSFSGDGMVIGAFAADGVSGVTDVAVDGNDKIVVVGSAGMDSTDPVVARLLPDGTPDLSFSGDGIAIEQLPYFALTFSSVAIDSAGRFLAAGTGDSSDAVVARYLPDGSLDNSFSGDGIAVFDGAPGWEGFLVLAVDSADRALVAGPGLDIMRLTASGQLDTSFSSDGVATTPIGTGTRPRGVEIDSAGRIVVAGTSDWDVPQQQRLFALRYLENGSLDTAFSGDGIVTTSVTGVGDRGFGLAIDLVGNIVVVGDAGWNDPTHQDFAVLRYLPDGSLDTAFSGDGIATTDWGSGARLFGVAIDQLGDIVVTGDANIIGVGRTLVVGRYDGAGRFVDDAGSVFEDDINWIAAAGITSGCNPPVNDMYCPTRAVTRGQMAAFLHRALGDKVVPIGDPVDFIDGKGIFAADIAWLSATGITRGCTATKYCPNDPVTRGQMAAFLVRAMGYTDDGGGDLFRDDDDSIFEADIDKLATAGVTLGCNPPANDQFCPGDTVTRGQMAAFLRRALGG